MTTERSPLPPAMAESIERWRLERLIPYARNARTHSETQVAQIAASIREFGFTNPILVDSQAGVIAGHGRLLAARQLGLSEVPVIVLDHLSEAQKRAYILADNRLAMNAGWDEELLRIELQALEADDFNLDLLGFDSAELDNLRAAADEVDAGEDADAIPEVPETPVSRLGDLWLLGPHRLLCGDATNASDIARLMKGELADLVFTDPPYNVAYEGYTEDRLTIQSDRMDEAQFRQFLESVFASYRILVKTNASLYVFHPSSWQREFQDAMEGAGFTIRCQIIWAKNTFAWGFGRFKFQHEPAFYAHVSGESDNWYGDKTQSTLWQEKKPAANRLHPTMKPVELVERALINSSKAKGLVVDLFGGSGSTLMGCERMKRQAALMEIDPKYCDVIVRRWQDSTGKRAVLEETGASFQETADAREAEQVEV